MRNITMVHVFFISIFYHTLYTCIFGGAFETNLNLYSFFERIFTGQKKIYILYLCFQNYWYHCPDPRVCLVMILWPIFFFLFRSKHLYKIQFFVLQKNIFLNKNKTYFDDWNFFEKNKINQEKSFFFSKHATNV